MKQVFVMLVVVALASGGCNNSSPSQPAAQSEVQSPAATATATPVAISLHAVDKTLNESGTATLQSADKSKIRITINITNEPKGDRQRVFMQNGTCKSLDGLARHPLSDLVDGKSVGTYMPGMGELLAFGPDDGSGPGHHSPSATPTPSMLQAPSIALFAITVWRYTPLSKTLVTCGDTAVTR